METVVPKKIRIVGRSLGASIRGEDVRVFDAETGKLFAECQAITFGSSIGDALTEASMLYIDFNAEPAPGEVVVEKQAVAEIVSIDIRSLE